MPYSFSTIEPNQIGQVTKWDVPLSDWLGVKFSEGRSFTFGEAISNRTEDAIWDDDNPVSPEILNRTYGIDNRLKFDSPMSIQRARLIHERKRKELERLAYLESGSHSWFSAKAALGFGASLVGGLAHPVDFGLAFLPFIGTEKAATQVARMGGGAFRQALARGAITTEEAMIARGVPFARLTAGVIDGTLSQAIVEIPVAIQKHRDMADYTLTDSVFNVVAGGAFAGALKGLGLALERAGKLWSEADPRVREAVLMDTVNSLVSGEEPKAHWAMGLDEATIRAKTEERIRAGDEFITVDDPKAFEDLRSVGVTEENARDLLDGTKRPEDVIYEQFEGITPKTDAGVKSHYEAVNEAKMQARVEIEAILQESSTRKAQGIDETRRQSIADFNAKAKADYEAKIKNQVDAETKRVMDEVRKQTQPLPHDVAKKHSIPRVVEDSHISAITEEIADLEADIMAKARTPEEVVRLQEKIKRVQAQAEELSGEKAVDKMLPCVAKRAE